MGPDLLLQHATPRACLLPCAGQTRNTSRTLEHLAASGPDVVLVMGDLSCGWG
jgi:hypothetical protein